MQRKRTKRQQTEYRESRPLSRSVGGRRSVWMVGLVALLVVTGCDAGDEPAPGENGEASELAEDATEADEDQEATGPDASSSFAESPDVEPGYEVDPECFGIEVAGNDDGAIECGLVEVPLHYDDPDGETIQLAVAQLPGSAGDEHDEPLLILGGGPGEVLVEPMLTEPMVRQLFDAGPDLIVIDQRGVGSSQPALECDDDLAADAGDAIAEDLEAALDSLRACYAQLIDEGVDLDGFNHIANARDVDLVRRALGHDRLNIRGGSYGTQVALLAAEMEPDHVRSVILSSPVDPTQNWIDTVAGGLDRSLELVIAACAADEGCSQEIGDLREAIEATVERLEDEPEEVTAAPLGGGEEVTRTFGPSAYLTSLIMMFYIPEGTSLLPALIDRARDGDLEPLAAIGALLERELDGGITTGMQLSMLCSGEGALAAPETSFEDLGSDLLEDYWFPEAIVGGAAIADACDIWDVELAYDPSQVTLASEVPTLIVTGGFDHVTPPQLGEQVDAALANSFLIEVGPAGHGALETLGACGQQIASDFLADPQTRPDDACVDGFQLQLFSQLPPGMG